LTASKESEKGTEAILSDNILRISDELVNQIDRTKKMVLVMIAAIVVGVPVSWHAASLLSGTPDSFRAVGYFTILVALVFVAVGVRQWILLSKWTERYKTYKELQQKVDAQLDFEGQAAGKTA
jgi:hypothetical protein